MASNLSDPILIDINKASLSCKDLLAEICQWTKESNKAKNVTDSLHKLITELENLEQYDEIKKEDTLAAISVNLQNLLPILLSNNISTDQLEIKKKEVNTLGIELITNLNKVKDKWLKSKGKINYINTSLQDIDDRSTLSPTSQTIKRGSSKRKSNLFTKSFHNSISHLSHSNNHLQSSSEEMEITGPINSPLYMQDKPAMINTMSLIPPPKTDPDMLETILRALPPKPTSSPFEVNAVPPLEIGKSYINNNTSSNTSGNYNENIQLPTISSDNEESLEQNILNVFDFIYGSSLTDNKDNSTEKRNSKNLFTDDKKVDNYEYKQMSDYEYLTKIPNTPLSETVYNQLSNNNNNNNNSKSREVKAFSIIKEESEDDKPINYSTNNIPNGKTYNNNNNEKGFNIFLKYKGETKKVFVKKENISYNLLKELFEKQFNCKNDFKDKEFPKIYINNQNMINLFYELSSSCSDLNENSILKLNIEDEKSKDELLSEIKELKTMINKTSLGSNTNNTSNNEKATDNEINKISNNTEISINTKFGKEDTSNTYKELSDIRASILDIVNNFVNSPVVKENKEVSPSSNTPNSDIQDLKDTINDWINYQKQISSSNIIQTPVSANPNNTNNSLVEPYKEIENMLNTRISSIQNFMNNELTVLNKNVNTKLDNIVTSINEKSPTSPAFKTPDSEDFMMNFNNDIKNNMNNLTSELKSYIKEVIDAKIDEKILNSNIIASKNSSGSNTSLNNTINELKNNVQQVNENINTNNNNLINELMEKISNRNDQKLKEMEERFNEKLDIFVNSRNNDVNNENINSFLENMDKSISYLKVSLKSKNDEIEKLAEITEEMNKKIAKNTIEKEDEQLKYMEFTKTLEEDIKQQLRKFKNDICNNMKGIPSEESNNNENTEKVERAVINYDQDTIDYVKQIRDNVDKQLLEFRRALFDLSENIKSNTSPTSQKGFNPEMIETVRSFRSEMKNQYQDFTEMIKKTLSKNETTNKINREFQNSGNKVIKDNAKETYNLINDEFFKLRQFMVEVIKISQTRKAPKVGEIGQLPTGIDEQQFNKKASMTTTNYNNLATKRNEINTIKKNIKNIKKQFETFRFDNLQNINKLKCLVSLLSQINPTTPSEQRQLLVNEKNALNLQSEKIKDKLQELRLLLESIGADVSRKCNPKIAVMNYVKNEIKMINSETQQFSETIRNINVNWKGIWEKELQEIVSEQKILKTNIENSVEFEDECNTLSDGFSVILKVLSMQKEKKEFKMDNVLDPEELQESGLYNGLMDEIKLVTDEESSSKRLEAIEKAMKIQEIIRENSSKNEFEVELNNFIESNKYKISKNVMEFENQQNAKKDEILKEMWKSDHDNSSATSNNEAKSQASVPAM